MNEIFTLESLADLATFLETKPTRRTQKQLAKLFFRYALYENAEQWNKAVRLCEALAIVGWGDYEPVQAERGQAWNGNPATTFFNRYSQERFVQADWSKRKAGLTMQQGSTWYHFSPDLPDKQSQGDEYEVRESIQDRKLASQRNWIPKNPILLGRGIANCYAKSKNFVKSVEQELLPSLEEQMTPEQYGTAINRIIIHYSLSYADPGCQTNYIILDEDIRISTQELYARLRKMYSKKEIDANDYFLRKRFDYGNFSKAKGTMKVDIHFPKQFSEQTTKMQKKEFAKHLTEAIDGVVQRLEKKKLEYDYDRMRDDFQRILKAWV